MQGVVQAETAETAAADAASGAPFGSKGSYARPSLELLGFVKRNAHIFFNAIESRMIIKTYIGATVRVIVENKTKILINSNLRHNTL
jgi:plastocyanin domain-containing protein